MGEKYTQLDAARALGQSQGLPVGAGIPLNQEEDFPKPEYTQNIEDDHMYTWEEKRTGEVIRVMVKHLTKTGKRTTANITVVYRRHHKSEPVNLLTNKNWDLNSSSSTETHRRIVERRLPDRQWDLRLALVEDALANNIQIGEPLVDLDEIEDPGPPSYTLAPVVEENEHNMIAADGGSTKSLFAMAVAVSYSYGVSVLPGMTPSSEPKPTLYIDYETNKQRAAYRKKQLVKSMGLDLHDGKKIYYRKLLTPITDAVTDLHDIIKSKDVGLVIIDSASKAVGGETNSEESVIPFFNACATFGVTILTIAHKPKDNTGRGPSGVAQWWNQSRNYWELIKDQTPTQKQVYIALRHDKSNDGELHEPLAYRIDFEDGIRYYSEENSSSEIVNAEMPVYKQIIQVLQETPNQTVNNIADVINKDTKHVSNELRKNEGKLFFGSNDKRNRTWSLMKGADSSWD